MTLMSGTDRTGLGYGASARAGLLTALLLAAAIHAAHALDLMPRWTLWLAVACDVGAVLLIGLTRFGQSRGEHRDTGTSGNSSAEPATFETFAPRLIEAFRVWQMHLQTAQSQTRDATERLLNGFVSILQQLDQIIETGAQEAAASGQDERARVLTEAERDLKELLVSLDGIVNAKDRVLGTIRELDGASKGLMGLADVVEKIARQTNLLALNAAIEAARAGQAGAGFAVVAGEVRSLAGRSAEAAKQIKGLIDTSVTRVEQGSKLVDHAGTTMHEVVTAIRRVNDIIGEISAASSDQSSGVRQVSEAVNNMDRTTQQNAALVEEMAAAAASLKNEAEELVESVAVFKMGTSEASNRTPQQAPRELQASQRKQLGYTQTTASS